MEPIARMIVEGSSEWGLCNVVGKTTTILTFFYRFYSACIHKIRILLLAISCKCVYILFSILVYNILWRTLEGKQCRYIVFPHKVCIGAPQTLMDRIGEITFAISPRVSQRTALR